MKLTIELALLRCISQCIATTMTKQTIAFRYYNLVSRLFRSLSSMKCQLFTIKRITIFYTAISTGRQKRESNSKTNVKWNVNHARITYSAVLWLSHEILPLWVSLLVNWSDSWLSKITALGDYIIWIGHLVILFII